MANCIHCNNPIILVPSATERAKQYGGVPSDYTKMFTAHAECTIKHRNKMTRELLDRTK